MAHLSGMVYYLSWIDANGYYVRQYQSKAQRDARLQRLLNENKRLQRDSDFYAVKIRRWEARSRALANQQKQDQALKNLFGK